jgi:hypothetical protein
VAVGGGDWLLYDHMAVALAVAWEHSKFVKQLKVGQPVERRGNPNHR